jgi:hypothetical protein
MLSILLRYTTVGTLKDETIFETTVKKGEEMVEKVSDEKRK